MTASPFHSADHEVFRQQVRRFVEREIKPHIERWEEAGELPRELHRQAAEAGVLQLGFPAACGGVEVPDLFYGLILTEELAAAGSGGLIASLMSHTIACPPLVYGGDTAQMQRFVRPVLEGEKIAALAITEPGGGSDVANLQTSARREGAHYVLNGSKTFITSGMRADFLTVAVRTGGAGMSGISLLLVEAGAPGFSRSPLQKMGWRCSDTATLYFDDCRIPVENLIGVENQGFLLIMRNFNPERLMLAAQACAFAELCYSESLAYARQRQTFGRALIGHQVIRHKLVDMRMQIDAVRAQLERLAWQIGRGSTPVAEVCLLKNLATTTLERVASEAMQIFGGAGYLQGSVIERIYRETKVLTIGGGSLEVLKDLAARQLGY